MKERLYAHRRHLGEPESCEQDDRVRGGETHDDECWSVWKIWCRGASEDFAFQEKKQESFEM